MKRFLTAGLVVGLLPMLIPAAQAQSPGAASAQSPAAAAAPIVWTLDRLEAIGGHPTMVLGQPRVIEAAAQAAAGGQPADAAASKALAFDGVDDGLIVDANPLSGLATFTVEVIFRPERGGPAAQRFVHLQEAGSDNRLLFETRLIAGDRWFLDTFLKCGSGNHTLFAEQHPHPIGPWYHAAVTVDGRLMRHYVNGKEELAQAVDFRPLGPGQTSLGVRLNQVSWYQGAIRTLRITPRVLAPAEFLKP